MLTTVITALMVLVLCGGYDVLCHVHICVQQAHVNTYMLSADAHTVVSLCSVACLLLLEHSKENGITSLVYLDVVLAFDAQMKHWCLILTAA